MSDVVSWAEGVIRVVPVSPRLVLVRSPSPSEWRPALAHVVAEHRLGAFLLRVEVRMLNGDTIITDPNWITENFDQDKIALLPRRTPAPVRAA